MKVLVTGGRGFVGSNLVHVLGEAGDEVLAPSHAELDDLLNVLREELVAPWMTPQERLRGTNRPVSGTPGVAP